jgi:hypothetical protein
MLNDWLVVPCPQAAWVTGRPTHLAATSTLAMNSEGSLTGRPVTTPTAAVGFRGLRPPG